MKCEFHPNAPAIGTCNSCSTPICGICAKYVGEQLLCESCENAAQMQTFVEEKQKETSASNVEEILHSTEQTDKRTSGARPDTGKKENFQIAVVVLCCIFMIWQIVTSLSAVRPLNSEEIAAEERSRNQIESCMLIFWEIADALSAGGAPDASLRCQDTNLPMIVTDVDGDLRISHPRPDFLGLADIYVTRSNPIPVLVEIP